LTENYNKLPASWTTNFG